MSREPLEVRGPEQGRGVESKRFSLQSGKRANLERGKMVRILRTPLIIASVLSFSLFFSCAAPPHPVAAPEPPRKEFSSLEEDSRIVGVRGKIVDLKEDLGLAKVSRLAFVPTDSKRVFMLLESKGLEDLEGQAKDGKEVTVTGTVTLYRGRNYLLLPPVMGGTSPGQEVLPEDMRFIDRAGIIFSLKADLKRQEEHRSIFVPKAGGKALVILENQNLERLEKVAAHGEREVAISGTITVYRGRNYILITRLAKDVF